MAKLFGKNPFLTVVSVLLIAACAGVGYAQEPQLQNLKDKKVLYIDAYHPEYGWSDEEVYVLTFEDWKKAYADLQNKLDIDGETQTC